MPCGQFKANAAFFRIGVIAHKFVCPVQTFCPGWRLAALSRGNSTLATVSSARPGKIVRHARKLVLQIAAEFVELFQDIRCKSYQLAQSLRSVADPSLYFPGLVSRQGQTRH
ncbi:MAG: hypothetical protein IPP22_06300 [Nitrosomonas sp.]|nr:hypothetical protein [Nitrosomonas sp.]